jgi:hypothetical protein
VTTEWSNEAAIRRWDGIPREAIEVMEPEGDFAKRHLVNPTLLRMLGDVRGRLRAGRRVRARVRQPHARRARSRGRRVEPTTPGIESYVHLPNFLIVAATS